MSKQVTAAELLQAGIDAMQQRATARDTPDGERSMQRAVQAFNALTAAEHSATGLSETHGWLFMVILKAARATAGGLHLDDYIDMAAYAGLAGEAAQTAPRDLTPEQQAEREKQFGELAAKHTAETLERCLSEVARVTADAFGEQNQISIKDQYVCLSDAMSGQGGLIKQTDLRYKGWMEQPHANSTVQCLVARGMLAFRGLRNDCAYITSYGVETLAAMQEATCER